jgi:hypothetical protein
MEVPTQRGLKFNAKEPVSRVRRCITLVGAPDCGSGHRRVFVNLRKAGVPALDVIRAVTNQCGRNVGLGRPYRHH